MIGGPLTIIPRLIGLMGLICNASSKPSIREGRSIGCQHKSTLGRTYRGEANTTVDGIPCQRWSDKEPHSHIYTHVGDHNYCRNPYGSPGSVVGCYTTDHKVRYQNCSVPYCPPMKALDYSLDNDLKPDENNTYTHASRRRKISPPHLLSALLLWSRHGTST